jgi:hypothetical protein
MVGVGGREENMETDLAGLDRNSMLFSNLPRSPSPMMQRFTQPLENVDIGYQRQQVSVHVVLLSCFYALLPRTRYVCMYISLRLRTSLMDTLPSPIPLGLPWASHLWGSTLDLYRAIRWHRSLSPPH